MKINHFFEQRLKAYYRIMHPKARALKQLNTLTLIPN